MREIKFRAWDKHARPEPMMAGLTGITREGECALSPDKDRFVLMQYTGLKDKNGKEIYEGDLLRVKRSGGGSTSVSEVYWEQPEVRNDHTGQYESLNGYVQFGGWKTRSRNEWNYAMHEGNFEVIGNIYENPELVT